MVSPRGGAYVVFVFRLADVSSIPASLTRSRFSDDADLGFPRPCRWGFPPCTLRLVLDMLIKSKNTKRESVGAQNKELMLKKNTRLLLNPERSFALLEKQNT